MGDHIFDRQVRRKMRGRDLLFAHASQQFFPTIELLFEHCNDLFFVVHDRSLFNQLNIWLYVSDPLHSKQAVFVVLLMNGYCPTIGASAAVVQPLPTPPTSRLAQVPKRKIAPSSHAARRSGAACVRPRSCKKPSTFHDLPNWRQIQGNLLVTVHTNQIIQWLLLICQDGACASPYRLASEIQVLTNMSYAYQDVFE